MVMPLMLRVGASESNTRKLVPAAGSRRMVRLLAPGPVMVRAPPAFVICGKAVKGEMVCGVANTPAVSKPMAAAVGAATGALIACRKLAVRESFVFETVNVVGVVRSSRFSTHRRVRRDRRFRVLRAKVRENARLAWGVMASPS